MKLWHAIAYINLGALAADHFVTSVASIFFPVRAARMYQRMFGARFSPGPDMIAVMKPWGALGIFAAIAGALPIFDPIRYRGVLYALIVLLGLRIYIRLVNARATEEHFAISRRRNWIHIYIIAQAAAIIIAQLIWW